MNDGLAKIGQGVFANCTSLESRSFPSTIEEIEKYAFSGCNNLTVVEFHGIVQTIGLDAFEGCHSLERFTLPSISTRLNNIMQSGNYPIIEAKIEGVRGVVERRGSILFVLAATMNRGRNWNTIKASLDQIVSWIRYHEIKEETTLFELALWKTNLDQVDDVNPANRDDCRIEVPGPVKDAILQYF